MMCHRIGREPTWIIGFGIRCVASPMRTPMPPQKMTTFISLSPPPRDPQYHAHRVTTNASSARAPARGAGGAAPPRSPLRPSDVARAVARGGVARGHVEPRHEQRVEDDQCDESGDEVLPEGHRVPTFLRSAWPEPAGEYTKPDGPHGAHARPSV